LTGYNFTDTYKHKGLRNQLVDLLKRKGINDLNVLSAIETLPRHFLLPSEFESHAYEDKAFPIGESQTISQPYTVAYQSQLLQVKKGDKILEIGTGSGYQGLVLQHLGAQLFTIERHQILSESAQTLMHKVYELLNWNPLYPAEFLVGDGTIGWKAKAPFDKIVVTAGAPAVPKSLVAQLNVGGCVVIPVSKSLDVQKMVRITKESNGGLKTEIFKDFSFVPLIGENGWNI
jgi:protein-L-isoaspartate(D-aspartate) O-methyltransferase